MASPIAKDHPVGHPKDHPVGHAKDHPVGHPKDHPVGHPQDHPVAHPKYPLREARRPFSEAPGVSEVAHGLG